MRPLQPASHGRHRIRPLAAERLDLLPSHKRKIPCIKQEPSSTPTTPLKGYVHNVCRQLSWVYKAGRFTANR
jgi:hypothetical protein